MSTWQPVLEQLVGERYGRLMARARLVVGSPADAEDLVQDALVATFTARARFASIGEAEQYVRLAITSRSVDRARRGGKERQVVATIAGWPQGSVPDPADGVAGPVLAALASLPPRQRACVVLRHLDDLSVRQTAQALGLSEGAVKRYTADAVAALAAQLGTTATDYETAPIVTTKEVRHDA